MDAYATINDMQEISWNTSYLLSNVDVGIREFTGKGYDVDNMQTMPPVELQLMTSQGSHTKRSHKSIAQMNHTKRSHKAR